MIEKLIGSGGQATVFLVKEETTMQEYAMKRVLIDFSAEGASRSISSGFAFNEIILMNKLQHENVLSLKAFFLEKALEQEDQIKLNLIMPYCELGDLQKLMHRKRTIWSQKKFPSNLDEVSVLQWILQLCKGVEYIHQQQIVHRDLKPSNIFITKKLEGEYILKIGDFGLAKNVQLSLAKTMVGTPAFMSPQLYNNEPYSMDADIWSVGCIIFWMLTDKTVDFKFSSQIKLLEDEMKGLHLVAKEELYQLMDQCLQMEPKKRPTATYIRQQLERILWEKFNIGSLPVDDAVESQQEGKITNNNDGESCSVNKTVNRIVQEETNELLKYESNSLEEWLTSLDLGQYISNFINNGYTSLLDVESKTWTDEELKTIGVDNKLARNLLIHSISRNALLSQTEKQQEKMEQLEQVVHQVKALLSPF